MDLHAMRMPLATEFKTRPNDNDRDARIKNGYVEVKGEQAAVRVRPGNSDLGSLGGAGLAQLLAEWNGLLAVSGDTLEAFTIEVITSLDWQYAATSVKTLFLVPFSGKFLGTSGTGNLSYSTDGITWSSSGTAWAGSVPVAGSSAAVIYKNSSSVLRTTNATSWATVNMPVSGISSNVAYGNGLFISVGANDSYSFVSSDEGATWVRSVSNITSASSPQLSFANGLFFLSHPSGVVYSSADGLTWTSCSFPVGLSTYLAHAAYFNGKYLVIASVGAKIYESSDGVTFSETSYQFGGTSLTGAGFCVGTDYVIASASKTGESRIALSFDVETWGEITEAHYLTPIVLVGNTLYAASYADQLLGTTSGIAPGGTVVIDSTTSVSPITADLLMSAETTGAAQSNQQMLIKTSEQGWIYTR